MARPLWKGAISFGLVTIPVNVYSATRRDELRFRQLDRRDNTPIREKRVNEETGDEVPWEDVVKGFEYDEGTFVVLEPDDFSKANVKATETIDIVQAVPRDAVPPAVLREAAVRGAGQGAASSRTTSCGRRCGAPAGSPWRLIVMRGRQHLAALIADERGHHARAAALRARDQGRERARGRRRARRPPEIKDKEIELAEQLVAALDEPWAPEQFRDEYRDDLLALIEQKAKTGHGAGQARRRRRATAAPRSST